MDTIHIEGLEFYGYHGVPDAEQAVGHRYVMDLRLHVDTREAGTTDDITATVDYSEVAACVLQISSESQFRLLEALADRCARHLMERFPRITGLTLKVRKPLPPMNAIVAAVGVEITRHRTENSGGRI